MNNRFILLLAIVFIFSGCITPWRYTTVNETINCDYSFSIKIPANWYTRQIHKTTVCTHNGLSLESILISRLKWSDTLSNGHLLPSNVLLHQLPELILGEYCARNNAFNLSITDNYITRITEFPVSKTSYTYTSPNSLTMSGIMYCIPFRRQISVISYEAESSSYYLKSIDDFSEMIRSINIKSNHYLPLPGIRSPANTN